MVARPTEKLLHVGERRVRFCGMVLLAIVAFMVSVLMFACASDASVGAAARYDGDDYISEDAVSSYVSSYRKQQGLENSSDQAWASFLADSKLDPGSLRKNVIDQLVIDAMVEKRASEVGAEVDEAQFAKYMETFKGNLAFGDDEIYRETLEMQGQTVEDAEAGFRRLFLQQALFEVEVSRPELTDDQVLSGIANAYGNGEAVRHIYRFTIDGFDEDGEYEKFAAVQDVREAFLSGKLTEKRFASLVGERSNDDELKAARGDDGWSIDSYKRNSEYQSALEETETGDVSKVFVDDAGYSFLWVDRTYEIPAAEDGEMDSGMLEDMPRSLRDAIKEGITDQYWQYACQEYLQLLLQDANVEYYPMPSDVPYNVDMSLADVQLEKVSSDEAASVSSASDGASGEASADGVGSGTAPSAASDGAADAGSSPQASS